MLNESELNALTTQILWLALGVGALFGAIAQRTHFCTMGAVSDIVNIGDWSRARMWALAAGIAIIGFNAMVALGWLDAGKSIYAAPRIVWLSNLVGGALFGFGMVLASGCGSKTLVRIGGGNLKSLVVFLVLGIAAYATLRGITGVLRASTVDLVSVTASTTQDLPSMAAQALGVSKATTAWWLAAVLGGGLVAWSLARAEGRHTDVLLGGVGIGLAVVAAWYVSGRLGFVAEHPTTLEEAFVGTQSGRMEGLTFVAPTGWTLDWLMFFSDKSKVLTFGVVTTVGVILGAAVVALATRSFRWEGFASVEDTANHLVGGVLMGVGGVTAMGCTIGQGLTGLSTLAVGSFVALAGIVGGAVLALKYQVWRLEQQV
jgi:uncharacterized protein